MVRDLTHGRGGGAPGDGEVGDVVEDGADVGLPVRARFSQGVAVERLVADDRPDSGEGGDLLDGLGVVGVLREDRDRAGGPDGVGGLLDLLGGG